MKERPASSFAHLLFVQAAISAKNHSQANSERRGGGGGRVKDNREDELTLWTCQQGKANRRMGDFPSWTIQIVLLGVTKLFLGIYKENKDTGLQEHSLSLRCLFFFSFPPLASFLSPLRMSFLVSKLCTSSRELFHSVPAIMNTFQPVSRPWMNMTVLLKNLKFSVHFVLFFCSFLFFFLGGGGGRLTRNEECTTTKEKNKLLLCIIM